MTTQTASRPLVRRLDRWTLLAFNPAFSRHDTALSDLVAGQDRTPTRKASAPTTGGRNGVLRRLDSWTQTVFNPYLASDHRN